MQQQRALGERQCRRRRASLADAALDADDRHAGRIKQAVEHLRLHLVDRALPVGEADDCVDRGRLHARVAQRGVHRILKTARRTGNATERHVAVRHAIACDLAIDARPARLGGVRRLEQQRHAAVRQCETVRAVIGRDLFVRPQTQRTEQIGEDCAVLVRTGREHRVLPAVADDLHRIRRRLQAGLRAVGHRDVVAADAGADGQIAARRIIDRVGELEGAAARVALFADQLLEIAARAERALGRTDDHADTRGVLFVHLIAAVVQRVHAGHRL